MKSFYFGIQTNDHKWYLVKKEQPRFFGSPKWILKLNNGDVYVIMLKNGNSEIGYREITSIKSFLGMNVLASVNVPKGNIPPQTADFETARVMQFISFS